MQKHKPFHIECKNGFEFILLQRFLFSIGCGWAGDGSKEVLLDDSGTYAKYLAKHGLTVIDYEIYNPDPDLNTLPDVQLKFTINNLPEIKKTLETPVYEVGDWVKLKDDAFIAYYEHNGKVTKIDSFSSGLLPESNILDKIEKPFRFEINSIERLATPEEISSANLNMAIERFQKFYKEYGALGVAVVCGNIEEAMKMGCACDCGLENGDYVVSFCRTGLIKEQSEELAQNVVKVVDLYISDACWSKAGLLRDLKELLNKY